MIKMADGAENLPAIINDVVAFRRHKKLLNFCFAIFLSVFTFTPHFLGNSCDSVLYNGNGQAVDEL